jgi:hypothetical protein
VRSHQIGAIEFGLHANLALKAGQGFIGDTVEWQNLHGAFAAHDFVHGLEDLTHPTLSYEIGDHVRSKSKLGLSIGQLDGLVLGDGSLFEQDTTKYFVFVDRLPLGLGRQNLMFLQPQAILPLLRANQPT